MPDQPWLSDDEQQAWRSFVEMRHLLERHLERHLQREFGLSDSDFEILVNLSESPKGRMRPVELGEATQWEKSRLSHHLSRMEKRGLVRREACNARYPEVVLTKAGRDAIKASAPANAARVRKFFIDVLGPERLAAFREASDDVIAAIEEHQKTDCPPEIRGR
ncbi:MarR family transcriptional regulator [Mycobacterium kyorinense]|uniref:MarR family transcriptional regulator n=1 Tax=Mycobacterium kyorinense TaxID=487514 RepID=A0A1A2YXE8_9MYCO|nr:MarR family winged helix-turn-helix transcriptional regulator [Mycobacterium kyorinense]OBI42959.1 MarR family transcriptional regulator [Mycobacterium kyorinense]